MISKEKATHLLEVQRNQIADLGSLVVSSSLFKKWLRDTEVTIERVFGRSSRHLADFTAISYTLSGRPQTRGSITPEMQAKRFHAGLDEAAAVLQSMIEEVNEYFPDNSTKEVMVLERDSLALLERLCSRFHLVVRQLRSRHNNRTTIDVKDEYDVQDLLHALLTLDFDDIRAEEWAPSYAGGASRLDFLLKKEQIVVEVKKTRDGLRARELGEQLIIDIGRYREHPQCGILICFVYDPDGYIVNPRGIENDLNREHDGLRVKVIIAP